MNRKPFLDPDNVIPPVRLNGADDFANLGIRDRLCNLRYQLSTTVVDSELLKSDDLDSDETWQSLGESVARLTMPE